MQLYEATPFGELIATNSGLADLASRLDAGDFLDPLVDQLSDEHSFSFDTHEQIEVTAIQRGREIVKTVEEAATLDRGLRIDPQEDLWRHIGKLAEGTMFPIPSIETFTTANDEDRLVVSGIAGLQLTNYRSSCHLLARSRFAEYGFDNFVDSCAFVGAYVIGRLAATQRKRIMGNEPSFTYLDDGVVRRVLVGGSFHGDFRMTQERKLDHGILSPINQPVEYGPVDTLAVAGYHSIEPEIVESMVFFEYLRSGKDKTVDLVNELLEIVKDQIDDEGNIGFTRGNFADYGDGDLRTLTVRLGLLLKDGDYVQRVRNKRYLHSSPYAPQSNTMFEIVATEEGIRFQNRDEGNPVDVRGIDIKREQYGVFFDALLGQTQNGLGRTAPNQLINFLISARDMLAS